MSKRQSTAPAAPKPPTAISSTVVISDNASLAGTALITLRGNTVIHPRSKILSTNAPVTIGHYCIISERSNIGLQNITDDQPEGVVLEDYVVVEVGAIVEARKIGEGSVIEVNANIGNGAVIGKHCKVGPFCTVAPGEILPDFTVIYGTGLRRVDNSEVEDIKMKMIQRQVEILRRLIPSNLGKWQ